MYSHYLCHVVGRDRFTGSFVFEFPLAELALFFIVVHGIEIANVLLPMVFIIYQWLGVCYVYVGIALVDYPEPSTAI